MNGVFLVSKKYCIGLDLRLSQDGFSIVICNGSDFREKDVLQALGRASRSFGLSRGAVLMPFECDHNPQVSVRAILKAREAIAMDDGPSILSKVIHLW